jgi:glycerate-2-kinase
LLQAVMHVEGGELILGPRRIVLREVDSIAVVGAGKASARMSRAVESILGPELLRAKVSGWVNVPDEQVRPLRAIHLHGARRGHDNRPTGPGVVGTRRILAIVGRQTPRDLTLGLFSGGGSALLTAPAPGITLREKRLVAAQLHDAGATIAEVNAVRKHISRVKGGGLLRGWRGGWLTAFVLSDVVGDLLDVIASGPTSTDPTSFEDALEVLRRYGLWRVAPASVRAYLRAGAAGRRPETVKQLPPGVESVLIGNNQNARDGAAQEARRLGFNVISDSVPLSGEASDAGARLARAARDLRDRSRTTDLPACLIAGGETTVRLGRSPGRGGRCQEMALAALAELQNDFGGIAILCAGTDGEDGPTDAAGALIDQPLAARAQRRGLDPGSFLSRHDSYGFFAALGGLLKTGPTGTNVMDLAVMLVRGPS